MSAFKEMTEGETMDDSKLRRRRQAEDALEAFDRMVGLTRLRGWIYRWSLRRWSRKWFERASKGWSIEDTYDFDAYLAGVIVGGVGALRESLHGYPSELDESPDPLAAWDSILELIQRGFRHLVDDDWLMAKGQEERERIEAEQDQAKRLLVYWFGALWD